MPRFYPNKTGTIKLVTSQGTWTAAAGTPIDVDDRTAAIFREAFLRGGDVIVESATPPVIVGPTIESLLSNTQLFADTQLVLEGKSS